MRMPLEPDDVDNMTDEEVTAYLHSQGYTEENLIIRHEQLIRRLSDIDKEQAEK